MVPRKTIARVHDLVQRENELGENNRRLEGRIGEGSEVSESVGNGECVRLLFISSSIYLLY